MIPTNLPAIATAISTVLGLIGFIIYSILYLSDKSSSSHLSKEIIEALKSTNISADEVSKLSPSNLKLLLASQTNLSKEIINSGIGKEIAHKARFLLVSSIGLIICALTFGIIWMLKPQSALTYNAYIIDNFKKEPISEAVINIENRTDIKSQKSDNNGFFQIKTLPATITLVIKHKNYKSISIRKEIVSDNELDTFLLDPIEKNYYRRLKGIVIDKTNNSIPLQGVKLFFIGDSLLTYSNENGFFLLTSKQVQGQSLRLRAIKDGYGVYDEYVSDGEDNIVIPLSK